MRRPPYPAGDSRTVKGRAHNYANNAYAMIAAVGSAVRRRDREQARQALSLADGYASDAIELLGAIGDVKGAEKLSKAFDRASAAAARIGVRIA